MYELVNNLEVQILCLLADDHSSLRLLTMIELLLDSSFIQLIYLLFKLIVILHQMHSLAFDHSMLKLIRI